MIRVACSVKVPDWQPVLRCHPGKWNYQIILTSSQPGPIVVSQVVFATRSSLNASQGIYKHVIHILYNRMVY